MLTIEQTRTAGLRMMWMMLLLLIACLVLASIWLTSSAVRRRGRVNVANLGSMSEQWLLQYRASHSS
jgi:hypothetical protein